MRKFVRMNKMTKVEETFVACEGTLVSISAVAKENSSEKKSKYYSFSAEVEVAGGVNRVAGQLYENLVPYLGGMPKPGDKLNFSTNLVDIQEGINTRWNIGGASVDEVTPELLDAIAKL